MLIRSLARHRFTAGAIALALAGAGCSGKSGTAPDQPATGGAPAAEKAGQNAKPQGNAGGAPGAPGPMNMPSPPPPPVPFEPLPAHVYVAKVKALLTGLSVTDDEVEAVVADPGALRGLIDRWMATPQFRAHMLGFFQQAFQQTQTDISDYTDLFGATPARWDFQPELLRSLEESFARTVLALIDEGRPFTEAVTTDRFMLNPPLMVILAALDAIARSDDAKIVRNELWPLAKYPSLALVRTLNPDPATGAPRPIPFEETVNPQSPLFMHFYDPMPYNKAGDNPNCKEPQTETGAAALTGLFNLMWGKRPGNCGTTTGVFKPEDFQSWRMVKVRAPKAGEERTLFWDLPRFRDLKTTELVLATPRVGFATTLAFFANWPTNASNASRVTVNQALIVGLGRSFDDRGTTVQLSETSVDQLHIQPGTTCFGCHQTLDPMRDFFRHSYNVSYYRQLAPQKVPATGVFTVDGSAPVSGNGIAAFARAVAEHPRFSVAWAQKLCHFANSEPCDERDPELEWVAAVFKASRFDWKVLVRELFSSPLVTFAATTKSAESTGTVVSIARRESLCAMFESRLGVPGACEPRRPRVTPAPENLALAVPSAGYSRGEEAPIIPRDPNLFFASATENLCFVMAARVVDAGAASRWASARPAEALDGFVSDVMGLPASDGRAKVMRGLLDEHHAEALKAGASRTDALRSAFMVACASPFALAHGM